ncbi:MAG: hypothetical protein ACU0BB_09640 [Paracoccaceae bacterium]
MNGIARAFMLVVVISALAGMALGIQMSATHDHTLAPAHGHLNLLGWVSCSIFAAYYHMVPQAAEGSLPKVHFALAVASLIILAPGIAMAINMTTEVPAKIGSVVAVLSMLTFGWVVIKSEPSAQA